MTIKRRASGSWVDPASIKRRSGGSWVTPTAIKRRVSGSWVTVWPTSSVQLTGGYFESVGGLSAMRQVAYYVQSDGFEAALQDNVVGNINQWLLSGAASDYEVRFTQTSRVGSGSATASTGWLNCGTTRNVQAAASIAGTGTLTANYTVELRLASSGTVLATTNVTLESNY